MRWRAVTPPEGRARWTLRLLAGQLVEPLKKRTEAAHEAVWCIPPQQSGEFVAAMEDVLKLYEEPYDPARPVAPV